MRRYRLAVLILVSVLWFAPYSNKVSGSGFLVSFAYAEIPKTINFQAKLTDKDGAPLNGSHQINFALYDALTVGNQVWQETQTAQVEEGVCNVFLGNVTPLGLSFDKPYWLELTVDGQIISPRQKLSASGYAFNAERLGGVKLDNLLYKDKNGNVGIGTTLPNAKLEVSGAMVNTGAAVSHYRDLAHFYVASGTGTLEITMPKAWSATMMQVTIKGYDYSSGKGPWEVLVGGYNYSTGKAWYNYSTEIKGTPPFTQVRLAYDSSNGKNVILLGNISTVWSYPAVEVSEFVASYSGQAGWDSGWSIRIISSEANITSAVTPVIKMYVTSTGNVGIGILAPGTKLDVAGQAKFLGSRIAVGDGTTMPFINTGSPGIWFSKGGSSTTSQFFGQYDATHAGIWNQSWGLVIDNTGKVGIGTATPALKFHVVGNNEFVRFENTNTTANSYTQIGLRAGSANSYLWTANQNSTSWGGPNSLNIYAGTGGAMTFYTNATEKVRILTDGNVGIGTTTPQEKLQVNGKIKAKEFVTGDITFTDKESGKVLWNMYEDEKGLYLKSAINGKVYRFLLEEIK